MDEGRNLPVRTVTADSIGSLADAMFGRAGGYVHICHIDPETKKFRQVAGIPARELSGWLPGLLESMLSATDYYMSVNTFTTPARFGRGLGWKTASLVACFADLDLYKRPEPIDEPMGVYLLEKAAAAGTIPPPSMVLRSGRGLWPLYFLHDGTGERLACPATPENRLLWIKTQESICGRLAALEPDPRARDLARIMRIPDTWSSTAGKRVAASLNLERSAGGFRVITYALPELAEAVGVPEYPELPPGAVIGPRSDRPRLPDAEIRRRRRGQVAMYQRRLQQLELLETRRGGFPEGCRWYALLILANTLGKLRVERDDMVRQVEAMAGRCRPPIQRSEWLRLLRSWRNIHKLTNERIASWLDVTAEESAFLAAMLAGDTACQPWPHAVRFHPDGRMPKPEPDTTSRKAIAEKRREMIRVVIREHGGEIPKLETIAARLDDVGVHAVPATIARDLRAIGLGNPRGHPEIRERRRDRTGELFEPDSNEAS